MKTDKWFYEFFLSQPGVLAELIPDIEMSCEFVYSAPVIKEREFRLDGVFQPVSDDSRIPVIFVEVQMQSDDNFYRRYFAEVFLYLEQYKVSRPWRGLLILPDRGLQLGTDIPYATVLKGQVTRLHLNDLEMRSELSPNLGLLQLLVTDLSRSAELGKALLESAPNQAEFDRRLSLIETILASKFPDLTKELIMQILDLKTMDITQSRFYQQIREEALQEGQERGRQEGWQEGRQEGRQEGEITLLVRQLKRRCGELPSEIISQLRSLSLSQLEDLGEAVLDFTSLQDLEAWLTTANSESK